MSEEKCRFINKNDKISCNNCHIGGFCDEVEINECYFKQLQLKDKMIELIMDEYYFDDDKPYYLEKWEQQALAELRGE